jgi:hypothetical protein
VLLEIPLEATHQTLAIERRLVLASEIAGELAPFRHDATIPLQQRKLVTDAEAARAGEGDEKTFVLGLGKRCDPTGTAHGINRGIVARGSWVARLDHANQAIACQRVARHRQVSRLEYIERQSAAG